MKKRKLSQIKCEQIKATHLIIGGTDNQKTTAQRHQIKMETQTKVGG